MHEEEKRLEYRKNEGLTFLQETTLKDDTNSKNRPQETSSRIYTKAICKLKITGVYFQLCQDEGETVCETVESEECFTKYVEECETLYKERCSTEYELECTTGE